MKAWQMQNQFGIESLKLIERDVPKPGSSQVLIRVKGLSLNFRDLMVVEGKYNPQLCLPFTPLSDASGEVVEVGSDVTRVKTGDRVAGVFVQGWISGRPTTAIIKGTQLGSPLEGVGADYIVLPESGVVKVPDYLTDVEAATLPVAALTAWHALIVESQVKPGESVLIQGTGGVSLFALQFAKLAGARVVLISSSDEKLSRARELGADELINSSHFPEWGSKVLEVTAGQGVEHVIEVVGGTLNQSLTAVRADGQINVIGYLGGSSASLDLRTFIIKKARIHAIEVGSREMFEEMVQCFNQWQLRPVVDQVFQFSQLTEALTYMKSGGHFGKISLVVLP